MFGLYFSYDIGVTMTKCLEENHTKPYWHAKHGVRRVFDRPLNKLH